MKHNDWNTLIILDAMRWDYGSKIIASHLISGTLSKHDVGVSATFQWYNKYWQSKNGTTLITANPMPLSKLTNFAFQNFKEHYVTWDKKKWKKVDPERPFEIYKEVQPDKCLLHLIPPHLPFIYGNDAIKLMAQLNYGNVYTNVQNWAQKHPQRFKILRKYYQNQIRATLDLIVENLDMLKEPVVITSDHGELLGESALYDHPAKPTDDLKPFLYKVPWLDVNVDDTLMNARLAMLGYLEP